MWLTDFICELKLSNVVLKVNLQETAQFLNFLTQLRSTIALPSHHNEIISFIFVALTRETSPMRPLVGTFKPHSHARAPISPNSVPHAFFVLSCIYHSFWLCLKPRAHYSCFIFSSFSIFASPVDLERSFLTAFRFPNIKQTAGGLLRSVSFFLLFWSQTGAISPLHPPHKYTIFSTIFLERHCHLLKPFWWRYSFPSNVFNIYQISPYYRRLTTLEIRDATEPASTRSTDIFRHSAWFFLL